MYARLLSAAGVLMVIASYAVVRLDDLSSRIPAFLLVFALMFALYIAAVVLLPRVRAPRMQVLALVWIVAIATRLVMLPARPSLSDDAWRYVWEGRVVAAGYNPFSLPPDSPELAFLRDDNYDAINHKHMATIYPPVAQGVFALAALIAPNVTAQKFCFMLFDLGTLALVMLLLSRRNLDPARGAIYGWSPLVIVEFAHSGHMDAVAIFFLMLALLFIERNQVARGMAAGALSLLAKFTAVVLAPFLVVRKRFAVWAPLAAAVIIAGYLPFAGAGTKLWTSLGVYGRTWNFNSLVYRLLEALWGNPDAIRMVLAAIVVVFAVYRAVREKDVVRYAAAVIACALLLSPTVYPWYIAWMLPFVCFAPGVAWVYFSGAVVASYSVWIGFASGSEWRLGLTFLALEYVPFYIMLILPAARRSLRA